MKIEIDDIHNDSEFDTNAINLWSRNSYLKSMKMNEKNIFYYYHLGYSVVLDNLFLF